MMMDRDQLLIGIDVGTTQTKAGVFHLDGRPQAIAAERYPHSDAVDNAVEQDPAGWWSATVKALRRVLDGLDKRRLLGVAVGGQGPTVVAMDRSLQPLGPALTWLDRRAHAEWLQLNQRLGVSLPPHAFVPRVMWLKANRPQLYDRTHYFCQAWDYIASQFCGAVRVSMSPSIAPWNEAQIAAGELDANKFPEMNTMATPLGAVSQEAALATGLPAGLPVVGGISDYFGGLIGSGAVLPGVTCDNGGTSQSFNLCWPEPLQINGAFCIASFDEGNWYLGGPASTTGLALEWWWESVLGENISDWSRLAEVETVPPGCEGLVFLPYLAGERAPIWDTQARGVFFGLSLNHERAHLTRAIMESVAFVMRHLIEVIEAAGAEVREIRATGGQARSPFWCQMKADITGRPVVIPQVTEAAVLGSAIIAGLGVGVFEDYTSAAQEMVASLDLRLPDEEHRAIYQNQYEIFRDLYPVLKPFYQRMPGETV